MELKVRELDSIIQKFDQLPCESVTDDTFVERAVCSAALAVGKELLAHRAVLLSTVYHNFTNSVEKHNETIPGVAVNLQGTFSACSDSSASASEESDDEDSVSSNKEVLSSELEKEVDPRMLDIFGELGECNLLL